MSCSGLVFRRPGPDDWHVLMRIMPAWWGGRDLTSMLPKIFFEHFRSTSVVAEHDGEIVAFLIGFICPDHAGEAYIHFAGVAPAWRRSGLGQDLYRRFFAVAEAAGCDVVRAVTAPVNTASVAFHRALGFDLLAGDDEVNGLPVTRDAGPQGDHLVHFELHLRDPGAAT